MLVRSIVPFFQLYAAVLSDTTDSPMQFLDDRSLPYWIIRVVRDFGKNDTVIVNYTASGPASDCSTLTPPAKGSSSSSSSSDPISTVRRGLWHDCTTDTFDNVDTDWSFNIGNGSPNPHQLTDPSPNVPREVAVHMPGWGNLELQNYGVDVDVSDDGTKQDGIKLTASIRNVTHQELQSGADYLLRVQSYQKIHIQWADDDDAGNSSYTSDVRPTMDFFKTCTDPTSCKKKFVTVRCLNRDLHHCHIAFVLDNWVDTYLLSARQDNATTVDSVTSVELFSGEAPLDPSLLWSLQLLDDGSWSIQSTVDGRFLTTRINGVNSSTELKCTDLSSTSAAETETELPEHARWSLQGIFSSRLFSNTALSPPYKVTGSIQIPNGAGTWPTFWLLPAVSEDRWPLSGELDIFDHVAYEHEGQSLHQVVHVQDFHAGNAKHAIVEVTGSSTRLVQYGIEVFRDEIRFYIDGNHTFTYSNEGVTGGDNYPFLKNPFNIVLNVAIGGWWGGAKGVDFSLTNSTMVVEKVSYCTSYHNDSTKDIMDKDHSKAATPTTTIVTTRTTTVLLLLQLLLSIIIDLMYNWL